MARTRNILDFLLKSFCALLFALLVITVVWQVISREILQAPSAWSSTLASYVFVWLALFGAALVFKERGHMAVEVLVRRCPPRLRLMLALLVELLIMVFALGILVWGGALAMQYAWGQVATGLPATIGMLYIALPISGLLIALAALGHISDMRQGRIPAYTAAQSHKENA